jgi:hypothetical protein
VSYTVDLTDVVSGQKRKIFSDSVSHVRSKHNTKSAEETILAYEKEFNLKVIGGRTSRALKIIFNDEQQYFLFALRWS